MKNCTSKWYKGWTINERQIRPYSRGSRKVFFLLSSCHPLMSTPLSQIRQSVVESLPPLFVTKQHQYVFKININLFFTKTKKPKKPCHFHFLAESQGRLTKQTWPDFINEANYTILIKIHYHHTLSTRLVHKDNTLYSPKYNLIIC